MRETDITIRADWHWVCAVFSVRSPQAMGGFVKEITPGDRLLHIELWLFLGKADLGEGVILSGFGVGRYKAADITITGQENTTRITIRYEGTEHAQGAAYAEKVEAVVSEIRSMASWAREYWRDSQKITADWVIEHYYRVKSQGGKITLRELADKYDFSRDYLRQAKKKYDRAGKWGAKSKREI